jgi:hypothetical protein
MKTLIRCGALICAVGLGACSQDSTGTQATPLLNADLATVIADNTGDDVDIMREPVLFTIGRAGARPGTGLNRTATMRPLQRIECPDVTRPPR